MSLSHASNALYRPDLHMHSTASDGLYQPAELALQVKEAGINLFALTDHETMLGLSEARKASQELGLTFIPGVEMNTAGHDEVHVLLYFVDESMHELTELIRLMNEGRRNRGIRIIERLNELGIPILMEDLEIPEGVFCNRPHIANALIRLGHVSSYQEAFNRFLGVGKPAYIERTRAETLDVIALARRIGAVPVLAHPELIRRQELRSDEAIRQMVDAGLMGIEAYHSKHSPAASKKWEQTARELDLLVTGGSDFHRPADEHGPLGCILNRWTSAHDDVSILLKRHREQIKGAT